MTTIYSLEEDNRALRAKLDALAADLPVLLDGAVDSNARGEAAQRCRDVLAGVVPEMVPRRAWETVREGSSRMAEVFKRDTDVLMNDLDEQRQRAEKAEKLVADCHDVLGTMKEQRDTAERTIAALAAVLREGASLRCIVLYAPDFSDHINTILADPAVAASAEKWVPREEHDGAVDRWKFAAHVASQSREKAEADLAALKVEHARVRGILDALMSRIDHEGDVDDGEDAAAHVALLEKRLAQHEAAGAQWGPEQQAEHARVVAERDEWRRSYDGVVKGSFDVAKERDAARAEAESLRARVAELEAVARTECERMLGDHYKAPPRYFGDSNTYAIEQGCSAILDVVESPPLALKGEQEPKS